MTRPILRDMPILQGLAFVLALCATAELAYRWRYELGAWLVDNYWLLAVLALVWTVGLLGFVVWNLVTPRVADEPNDYFAEETRDPSREN